jgi:hypothetical protein
MTLLQLITELEYLKNSGKYLDNTEVVFRGKKRLKEINFICIKDISHTGDKKKIIISK